MYRILIDWSMMLLILAFPIWVTYVSIKSFIKPNQSGDTINDIIIIVIAPFMTIFWGNVFVRISNNPWTEINVNNALHAPVWPDAIPTFVTLIVISLIGYVLLNSISYDKLPPLILGFGIAALYIGIALSLLWTIQMLGLLSGHRDGLLSFVLMCLMPWNYALISIRTLMTVVRFWEGQPRHYSKPWLQKLYQLLYQAKRLPIGAFLLLVPLLGLVAFILTLFGQEPDALIKMWTNTSDWTLSQQVSPPSVSYDEHYLCTVGASGHRNLVKPIRMGVRHGHRIVVNRQLLIANAFEQVIEERLPRTHRLIRHIYDTCGDRKSVV